MKNKLLTALCLMMFASTGMAQVAAPKGEQRRPPALNPVKVKEAREACMKEHPLPPFKKGDKPDLKKMEKFRNCMHEKLAPEINRVRQQRK